MNSTLLSRSRIEMPLTHRNLILFPLVDDNPKEADNLLMSDAEGSACSAERALCLQQEPEYTLRPSALGRRA